MSPRILYAASILCLVACGSGGSGPECPSWYPDADLDGYGDAHALAVVACEPPEGHVDNADDCDDTRPSVNPEGKEVCDPEDLDQDCNGLADDADPNVTGRVDAWPDADGDGHGDASAAPTHWCDPPTDTAPTPTDCNDADPDTYVGAAPKDGPAYCMTDRDGDGYGSQEPAEGAQPGTDCDDADAERSPGAQDRFGDGIDQDCDGEDLWQIRDTFELSVLDPRVFSSFTGEVAVGGAHVAQGSYSVSLAAGGAELYTVQLDATACRGLMWSYEGKRGPEQPDAGETLQLAYFDGTNWVVTDTWEGNGAVDPGFSTRMGLLTEPRALHASTQLRLVAAGGSVGFDHFHLDNFTVACGGLDADGDGFPSRFDCDDTDPAHWSDCGVCVDADGDDHGEGCDLGPDCDDDDDAVHPGAPDPRDGVDTDCDTVDGPYLFDDFELGTLDPTVWDTVTGTAIVSSAYVARGGYAMDVEGTGEAVTHPLDARSCPDVRWSMRVKRGPDTPEATDDLVLWYHNGVAWQEAHRILGEGVTDPGFTEHAGIIDDPTARIAGLRMKLSWHGTAGSDDYYIDDFVFGCPADQDGDGALADCDDTDPDHWADCGVCVDADGDGRGTGCDLGPDCDDTDPGVFPGQPDVEGDGEDVDCTGVDGPGFFDDFEHGGALAAGIWVPEATTARPTTSYAARGSGSLHIEGGNVATTLPLDATACDALTWSYQGKRGADAPEVGDTLTLEALTLGGWEVLDVWQGDGAIDPAFLSRGGPITVSGAFHDALQLRFVANGTTTDDWYVDDFEVLCGEDADGDLVIDEDDCAPDDPWHWSDCGVCEDADQDGFGAGCDLGPDCDDTDDQIHPGAPETLGDGIDSNCDTLDGVGIVDDFEDDGPSPRAWASVSGSVEPSTTFAVSGQTSVVLFGSGGTLETVPMNALGCGNVRWSFMGKRGPEQPDAGEFLVVSYHDGTGWVVVDEWEGGATDPDFLERSGTLGRGALSRNLRMRIQSNGTSGNFDHWFIDDFALVCAGADADGDGFPAALDCDDADPRHWSDCGLCVDLDDDGYGLDCDLGPDCDDDDSAIRPGVVDPLDGIDQNCDRFDGPSLFDDFEAGAPRPNVWESLTGEAALDDLFAWSGRHSLLLQGVSSAETVVFDTTTCPEVVWYFQGKRGPDAPEVADTLTVSWFDGAGWVTADTWTGNGGTDADFQLRWGSLLSADAYHSGFRLRLETAGAAGADAFRLDDFGVGCSAPDLDGDGFPVALDCNDEDDRHWSDCGACVDLDDDGYGLGCDLGWDCDDSDPSVSPEGDDSAVDGVDGDCDGADGAALADDFESGEASPLVWALVSGDVAVTTEHAASGQYGLTLGGGGGQVASHPLDTSECGAVVWRYAGKRGPEVPEAGDTLTLSWFNGASWQPADVWEGDGTLDPTFVQRWGVLTDPSARSASFQVRLESVGTGASFDHFHVDDLVVGCLLPDADGDGLPGGIDCDDADPAHWSDCGSCEDPDGDDYGEGCDLGVDCDETDPTVNPGAPDPLGDSIDQDCSNHDGPGLYDGFEDGFPVPNVWASQVGTFYDPAHRAAGTLSLRIEGGGEAETVAVDLSSCDAVYWSYLGKRGPDVPEAGEALRLWYDDGAGFVELDAWEGNGLVDASFVQRWGVLDDPAALWTGFRLLITADGTITDDFFIDELHVGCDLGDLDGDGVSDNIDCAPEDERHAFDCGICDDPDDDGYGDGCDLGPDCAPDDPAVHPGAVDVLGDGVDDDCTGADGPGLLDDFELGYDPAVWAYQNLAVFYDTVDAWSGRTSLRLEGGAEAETVAVDLSVCSEVFWAYRVRTGPELPETGDDLVLAWDDGTAWVEADRVLGNGVHSAGFELRWGVLTDPLAPWEGFRLQLTALGISSDEHLVDDLMVGCHLGDADGDGLPANIDCDDADPWHWQDCLTCVDADDDGFGTLCDLGTDCDDDDATVYPGADDLFIDGQDLDCDLLDFTVLAEDFSGGIAPGWPTLTGEAVIEDIGLPCPGLACGDVLRLSGTSSATSVAWDSSACNTVGWAYAGRRGPEAPDATDLLRLEWNGGAGWVTADTWVGNGSNDPAFLVRAGTIPDAAALSPALQVRLVTNGAASSDHFFVDDIRLGCAD